MKKISAPFAAALAACTMLAGVHQNARAASDTGPRSTRITAP